MKLFKSIILLILFVCFGYSQIPEMINYQGYITNSDGEPFSGNQTLHFVIYDQHSDGDAFWKETQEIEVENGLFSVMLGAITPLASSIFNKENRYLGIAVGDDNEMKPRKQFTSVGYAFKSSNSDSLNGKSGSEYIVFGEKNAISEEMLQHQYIKTINNVGADNNNVSILAGDNIELTNNSLDHTITISSTAVAGSGDNLGNHQATVNLHTRGNWISNDGDSEGIWIRNTGQVGIGTNYFRDSFPTYKPKLKINSESGTGIQCDGEGLGGVFTGRTGLTASGSEYNAILATNNNENPAGKFLAYAEDGTAVYGETTKDGGKAIHGIASFDEYGTNYGGYFEANAQLSRGVYGEGNSYGGFFISNNEESKGVYAYAHGNNSTAIYGHSGLGGNSSQFAGYFRSASENGYALYARSYGANGFGIHASGGYYAGYFGGDVRVTGTLSKSAGSFKIDHPQDPENKYLQHSFVESPDMMNLYKGNVILDSDGSAVVELPEYFEALNIEYNYQLTCVGGFAQVYISKEISNNQFEIAGGTNGLKVCWEVSGVRNDAYARNHPIEVVVEKTGKEKGTYIFPEDYGKPASMKVGYEEEQMRIDKEKKMDAKNRSVYIK